MMPSLFSRNIKAALSKILSVKKVRGVSSRGGKLVADVEGRDVVHLQEWGFFGKSPKGGEAVCIYPRGSSDHGYAVLVDGPGRPSDISDGECGLFNGTVVIRLKEGVVTIEGAEKFEIGSGGKALVTEDVLDALIEHTHGVATDPLLANIGTMKTKVTKAE
jgi:phage gp45-like